MMNNGVFSIPFILLSRPIIFFSAFISVNTPHLHFA